MSRTRTRLPRLDYVKRRRGNWFVYYWLYGLRHTTIDPSLFRALRRVSKLTWRYAREGGPQPSPVSEAELQEAIEWGRANDHRLRACPPDEAPKGAES